MKLIAALALASLPAIAAAQPSSTPSTFQAIEAKAEPVNSVNVSPLGLLFGNYAVTYERLFNGTHGLVLEGVLTRSSNSDGDSMQLGGSAGYRWHWRGKQNSGFLGVMVTQTVGSGSVTINEQMTYDMSVRSTMVTGNIGKRWMIGDHVNVTLRFGLGWGNHVASAKQDSQEAKDAEKTMNDILAFFPIGFDGELSLGYTF